jgi:CheY-like chemotaxis protein
MESTMSAEETGSASEPTPRRYPRSVLVVDDDPSVRTLLQMVLQVEGFDVRCASDGASAYEMIAASCPDVLLVDVLMPGLDGRALTRRLREDPATAGLPIVICSALTDDRDQWAAWASGANAFVSKPFDVERLVGVLADVHATSLASASRPVVVGAPAHDEGPALADRSSRAPSRTRT